MYSTSSLEDVGYCTSLATSERGRSRHLPKIGQTCIKNIFQSKIKQPLAKTASSGKLL